MFLEHLASYFLWFGALAHLTWHCSGCDIWTRSRPSRIQPPLPAVPAWRTCSCPGPTWWCPPPGPHSAETPPSGGRPHPSPRWPVAGPQATGSSPRWPESSACLCSAATEEAHRTCLDQYICIFYVNMFVHWGLKPHPLLLRSFKTNQENTDSLQRPLLSWTSPNPLCLTPLPLVCGSSLLSQLSPVFALCGELTEEGGYDGWRGGLWGYRVAGWGWHVVAATRTRGPQRPSKPGVWSGWANRRWEGLLKDPSPPFPLLRHTQISPSSLPRLSNPHPSCIVRAAVTASWITSQTGTSPGLTVSKCN